jgi:uracil-DNA glycosylase
MRADQCVACRDFPCTDVQHAGYAIPGVEVDVQKIRLVLISEAAPANRADDYYASGEPLFAQTTVLAFQDAGVPVATIQDIRDLGVYFTTAVKCAKTGYGIQTTTIEECSRLLEQELDLFPRVQVYLLMGDVAIKAVNAIAKRAGEPRVIPAGATYKIRGQAFYFRGRRALPSYLQAGPSFFIEKSKRKMIAEDIRAAFSLLE